MSDETRRAKLAAFEEFEAFVRDVCEEQRDALRDVWPMGRPPYGTPEIKDAAYRLSLALATLERDEALMAVIAESSGGPERASFRQMLMAATDEGFITPPVNQLTAAPSHLTLMK